MCIKYIILSSHISWNGAVVFCIQINIQHKIYFTKILYFKKWFPAHLLLRQYYFLFIITCWTAFKSIIIIIDSLIKSSLLQEWWMYVAFTKIEHEACGFVVIFYPRGHRLYSDIFDSSINFDRIQRVDVS